MSGLTTNDVLVFAGAALVIVLSMYVASIIQKVRAKYFRHKREQLPMPKVVLYGIGGQGHRQYIISPVKGVYWGLLRFGQFRFALTYGSIGRATSVANSLGFEVERVEE
jgi:hypothetical protein